MSGAEPCYHGIDSGFIFMQHSFASTALRDFLDGSTSPIRYCKAADAVLHCQEQRLIPITMAFSRFLISTAVDALIGDGDPPLPPEDARIFTQMGLVVEKLVKEQEENMTFDSEYRQTKYRYSEVFCLDGGANIVPFLKDRIPCDCLDNTSGTCFGCHALVQEKKLRTCTGCETAEYCSKACQRKSWNEQMHRENCKKIREIVNIGFKKQKNSK